MALLPLGAWALFVAVRPGDLPLARGSWLLVGLAAIVLTAGLAALASRRAVTTPGSSLASASCSPLISPVVIANFLDWDSLYPIGDFSTGVLTIWLAVAGAGVLACATPLRP